MPLLLSSSSSCSFPSAFTDFKLGHYQQPHDFEDYLTLGHAVSASLPSRPSIPADLEAAVSVIRTFEITDLVFHDFTESVRGYAGSEPVPKAFPRPDEHIVIADYLIDLPVVAADLCLGSAHYGRVLGYCTGNFWLIADSFSEFAERLQKQQESALYGK